MANHSDYEGHHAMNNPGDLRVWWIPRVPMRPFYVDVKNIQEAALILNTLAEYDLFQYDNNIKPDYCNVGGLETLDEYGDWSEWYDDNGYDIDEITRGAYDGDDEDCDDYDNA